MAAEQPAGGAAAAKPVKLEPEVRPGECKYNLTGVWELDSKASDDMEPIMALQGVPWLIRKGAKHMSASQHIIHGKTYFAIELHTTLFKNINSSTLDGNAAAHPDTWPVKDLPMGSKGAAIAFINKDGEVESRTLMNKDPPFIMHQRATVTYDVIPPPPQTEIPVLQWNITCYNKAQDKLILGPIKRIFRRLVLLSQTNLAADSPLHAIAAAAEKKEKEREQAAAAAAAAVPAQQRAAAAPAPAPAQQSAPAPTDKSSKLEELEVQAEVLRQQAGPMK